MTEHADGSRIIVTKILVPRKRQGIFHRPRLTNFLHDQVERKLILISAAPGCGKTSLLIDFAHNTDLPVCWLALDETDRDATTLFEYVIASIRQRFPAFGERSRALLRGMQGAILDAQSMVTVLVNEIHDTIPEYFMLVIDDYHLAEGSQAVQIFFDLLLRYLPENCHILLASRTMPALPLVRLAAYQEVAGLGTSDLAFTVEEIQGLFHSQYNLYLPDDTAAGLARESDGWITGILLTAQTFWRGLVENLARVRGTPEQIFEYLAREVFSQQPAEIRRFLQDSSILRQLNPELCDELLGISNSRDLIEWVEQRNLFMTRLEGQGSWYTYSRLFQEFLRARLRRERESDFCELHERAAAIYEARGLSDEAVHHWLQARNYPRASRLIEEVAPGMFQAGRLETLQNWIDALPFETRNQSAELLVTRARIHIIRGEIALARQILEQAAGAFEAVPSRKGQATVLIYQSAIAAREGNYQDAVSRCKTALGLLGGQSPQLSAEAHRNLGLGLLGLGRLEEAYRELEQSLALYERLSSPYHVATVHQELGVCLHALGNSTGADLHYIKSLALWEQIGNGAALANVLNSMAVNHHHRGEYDQALELFERALMRAREAAEVRFEGYVLAGMGDVKRDLGDYAMCQDLYNAALDQASRVGDGFLTVYSLDALGNTSRLKRDYASAAGLLRQALAEAEEHQSSREIGFVENSLGSLYCDSGDSRQALEHLDRARSRLEPTGARADLARVSFNAAQAHYHARHWDEALASLQQAMDLAYQAGIDQFLIVSGAHAIPLLRYAARRLGDQRFSRLLSRIEAFRHESAGRPGAEEAPQTTDEPAPALEIRALGTGAVYRDGLAVSQSDWGAAQARELFFFLLDSPDRSKDQIGDVFWPEHSSSRMTSIFHATLYRVRRAAGRDCIRYNGERYAFNTDLDYSYDVAQFEALTDEADAVDPLTEEAARRYRQAVDIYRGDFLEDVYSDWAFAHRESLRQRFLIAVTRLAKFHADRNDYRQASRFCRMALERDEFWEEAHRQLMLCYAGMGQRSQALQHYEKLVALLLRELDTVPSAETTAVYSHIRNDQTLRDVNVNSPPL
jgi:ATP/maltotriose-dependent transcriptional regulator MalT/DNA-binding SARP family transcriptional activator